VTFNATSGTKLLNSSGHPFYNLTFSGTGAQWTTYGSSLTVNHNLLVQAGTFVLANVSSSAVQGTVAVSPGATWSSIPV